jgi:hypothetical protein
VGRQGKGVTYTDVETSACGAEPRRPAGMSPQGAAPVPAPPAPVPAPPAPVPGQPGSEGEWLLAALEPDQLVAAKEATRYGQRRLGVGARLLMWGMRAYVLFTLVVVVYRVWAAVARGGSG